MPDDVVGTVAVLTHRGFGIAPGNLQPVNRMFVLIIKLALGSAHRVAAVVTALAVDLVNILLMRNGHDVSAAQNGKEALEMLRSERFDGLITDVNMPLMRGIDLVKHTLELPDHPDFMVVLTSRCDLSELGQKVNSPKVHFFNKPFSPGALAELIQELTAKVTAR